MNRARPFVLIATLAATLVAVPAAAQAESMPSAATSCTASALPMPPGGSNSHVRATNGKGVYVGTVGFSSTSSKGAVWRNGGVEVLDEWFSPTGMNSSGFMSGQALADNSRTRAAMLQLDGQLEYLAGADSGASDVNENGDIVGSVPVYRGAIGSVWPVSFRSGRGLTPYGTGRAHAIDDDGWILGSYTYSGPVTEYLWRLDGDSAREVRRYQPDADGNNPLRLFDVDNGQVVATRATASGTEIVVIDAASGAIRPVPGTQDTYPVAINNGVIIGGGPHGDVRPTMWRNGETVALPGIAGGRPWQVSTVNANGTEITGNSVKDAGGTIATVWRCSL